MTPADGADSQKKKEIKKMARKGNERQKLGRGPPLQNGVKERGLNRRDGGATGMCTGKRSKKVRKEERESKKPTEGERSRTNTARNEGEKWGQVKN